MRIAVEWVWVVRGLPCSVRGRRLGRTALLTAVGLVAAARPAVADAASRPAITTSGTRFVTGAGTPVVLRGVNLSYAFGHPEMVQELGANFARIRVLWSKIEPERGVYDQAELARLDLVVQTLDAQHIAIELDLRGSPVPAWFGSPLGFWNTNRHASHVAYKPFVRQIVERYSQYPYVIGFGIFNEPYPFAPMGRGTHRIDQTILRWQAAIRNEILEIDPSRLVFFNVRGGNYGIKHANFKAAGFRLSHVVYDWHSYYNGAFGSGFDEANDNWIPSWPETHNQRSTDYQGTLLGQWLNLAIPWKRTHLLGIPMIVGEWGVRNDDAHFDVYDRQMGTLFTRKELSWARWDIGYSDLGLLDRGGLNAQGVWLRDYIAS
jgi:aryl-phospho-beta-D-glucosidase BglC (GH1 family)